MKFTKLKKGPREYTDRYEIVLTDISAQTIVRFIEEHGGDKIPNNENSVKQLWKGLTLLPQMQSGSMELSRLK